MLKDQIMQSAFLIVKMKQEKFLIIFLGSSFIFLESGYHQVITIFNSHNFKYNSNTFV